jgi:outer membrane protein assembly factor BamE (lipoprotein component of BamABCDE complex)
MRISALVIVVAVAATGCKTGGEHLQSLRSGEEARLTLGEVQRQVHVGMSSADVAQAIGSPNIVSTDEERREVWIYDRIATERAVSESGGSVLAGGGGAGSSAGGGGALGYGSSAGASMTSQRTMTVIIKYDHEGRVRDFAYHASRF